MRKVKWLFWVTSLLFISGCGIHPSGQRPILDGGPVIKIGLQWGTPSVRFSLEGDASIINEKRTFLVRRQLEGTWRADVLQASAGKTLWFVVAASMPTRSKANAQVQRLRQQGLNTFIYPAGQKLKVGARLSRENGSYRVCFKQPFKTEAAAKRYQKSLQDPTGTFIIKHAAVPPGGTIRLVHEASGQEFASSEPIVLKGDKIVLHDVPVGTGFHWARKENRSYPEDIILQVGADGGLTVINRLPLESYLRGVVPSEMPSGFPLEALKAQAVAARSETLAKLGVAHTTDPFDLCADVHCQAYSGLTRRHPATDQAVLETKGEILMKGEHIVDAVYSSVCGGHGESARHAWGGEGRSYLQGKPDGPRRLSRYGKLTRERAIRQWIDADVPAYCNASKLPPIAALDYTRKYWRWELTFSQLELRTQLEHHQGRSVGDILKLEPMARGDSGRITQLRVKGRTGVYMIQGELAIRKALSATTLWSSCFYVTTDRGVVPQQFTLKGAGFGHGVGMCQTGAAGMALQHINYKNILKHYYTGSRIRRLY